MKKFAQLLDRLYFTYSHLAKTELLKTFFHTTPDPERGYALAIMANAISFPNLKRGLIKQLIENYIDPVLFELSYDYIGDLSETAALLWPEDRLRANTFVVSSAGLPSVSALPPLSEIIAQFSTLSKPEIEQYLKHLLDQSDATERWALLKLGTGSMRIGVSARFLKQALAKFGEVNVHTIEKIWHAMQPPYLELFAWLEGKTETPKYEDNVYFHPVMLSHPFEEKNLSHFDWQQFAIERKYDGIRVQLVSTPKGKALYTRNGDEISHSFPDILEHIHSSVVLDGELVIRNSEDVLSFNHLQQRLNRKKPSKKLLDELPAGIILYDLLGVNQVDLRERKFVERRAMLEEWFNQHHPGNMILSEVLMATDNITKLKQAIMDEKHIAVEGLMLKHKDSPYIAGRPVGYWYKWKRNPLIIDAVLMYAQRGHGKRSSFYSDYTFGVWHNHELLPIGKAYFGFTDEELKTLDRWVRQHTEKRFGPVREVKKLLVFEVAFDSANYSTRHKSGVALRFPRINRIRWDKPVSEADTLENVKNLIII